MTQPAVNDSRNMMIALARRDARDLDEAEQAIARTDPMRFNHWVAQFAADPTMLRTAAPVEVAVLLRTLDAHPGWVDDPRTLHQVRANIVAQLGDFDHQVVRGSRAHAVDTIRQAQNPDLATFRASVLAAMDQAHQDVSRTGSSIQTAFANRLAERGLITTDPELGEPFEHIKPGSRAAGVDRGQDTGWEPTAQVRGLAR